MNLPCYLVRDLLPLYHDKLCAPDTTRDVDEHLAAAKPAVPPLQPWTPPKKRPSPMRKTCSGHKRCRCCSAS